MTLGKTVLFVANRGYALTNSRKSLIGSIIDAGSRVVFATADDEESQQLVSIGATHELVQFDRGGFSPVADAAAFRRLVQVHRRWRPDLVQHFHAKPVILGSMAAKIFGTDKTAIVNTITGLGHAFITGGLTARLSGLGYRLALKKPGVTIFQNKDDFALFQKQGWAPHEYSMVIPGSGVDIAKFAFVDRSSPSRRGPVVILLARLLRQKGIQEFIEVAERTRRRNPNARFIIAGEVDPVHPDALPLDDILSCGLVEYAGRLEDVRELLEAADIMLFPSYREGVPRAILEAAATGLPTVAFDVPGVREAVRHGRTGFLADFGNVESLADYVLRLLDDDDLRGGMGTEARKFIEDEFAIQSVQKQYLELYKKLLRDSDDES